MLSKRRLGLVSLCVTATGFLAVELLLLRGVVRGAAWRILSAAFEAGTVGGMADWFAVTALFREVKIPILRRHTNIISKNRAKLVDGIADMVQNKWLSREVILEHLARFSASDALLLHLANREQRMRLVEILCSLLAKTAADLDGPEAVDFLERQFREQLRRPDLARPLGEWILHTIQRRGHDVLWDVLLSALEKNVRDPVLKRTLSDLFVKLMNDYRLRGGVLRNISIGVLEEIDAINVNDAVEVILANLERFLHEAQDRPEHPFRQRQDALLLEFARRLADNDPESVAAFGSFQAYLAANTDLAEYIRRVLSHFKGMVLSQAQSPESELGRRMERLLEGALRDLSADSAIRRRVNDWVRETFVHLVEKHHAYIGEMVHGSLNKLDDRTLVRQIEGKVGDELQYIRLNGAVIGSMVGAVLEIVRLFVLQR
jgi:uncharacterized membrane-anchored protein YjiN (DUF445 family)